MSTHHHTRHFNLGSGDRPQLHILPRCALYRLIPIPSPKCSVLGNTKMSNSRKQRSGWINIHVSPWNQPCVQNPLKTSPTYELKSSFIQSPHAHPVASTPEPRRNNCGSLSSCLNFLHSLTLPIKSSSWVWWFFLTQNWVLALSFWVPRTHLHNKPHEYVDMKPRSLSILWLLTWDDVFWEPLLWLATQHSCWAKARSIKNLQGAVDAVLAVWFFY